MNCHSVGLKWAFTLVLIAGKMLSHQISKHCSAKYALFIDHRFMKVTKHSCLVMVFTLTCYLAMAHDGKKIYKNTMHAHISIYTGMRTNTAYVWLSTFHCRFMHMLRGCLICQVMSVVIWTTVVFLLIIHCSPLPLPKAL